MHNESGYLLLLTKETRAELNTRNNTLKHYTDAVQISEMKYKERAIVLLSYNAKSISELAICEKGKRVSAQKSKITITCFTEIDPILFDDVNNVFGTGYKRFLNSSSASKYKRFSTSMWVNFVKVLGQLSRNFNIKYNELSLKIKRSNDYEKHLDVISQERDAIALAIQIFCGRGYRAAEISKIPYNSNDEALPFLQGVQKTNLLEDRMIEHDARIFGDWALTKDTIGACVFDKGGRRLSITNVNRHKVEHTLGVDLIYYHGYYKAYTMVQYKRMIEIKDGIFQYSLDTQFYKDLERMNGIHNHYVPVELQVSGIPPSTFRVNHRLFHFKFCKSVTLDPTSTELIDGNYMPIDYVNILLESGDLTGPRGGNRINSRDTERNMSNTLFTDLVEKGWIGSQLDTTDIITDLITDAFENRRSVILAAEYPR